MGIAVVGEEAREDARDEGPDGGKGGADYGRVDFDSGPGGGADVVPYEVDGLVGRGSRAWGAGVGLTGMVVSGGGDIDAAETKHACHTNAV